MIRREYVHIPRSELAGGSADGTVHNTHYRVAGSGPPLILLHPSPMSSAFMLPLIELLQDQATVYALDTPGYGQSDALPEPADNLDPYVQWLKACMQALGLESAGILGSATGAQIAIQFARQQAESTRFVILENAVHFNEDERADILRHYFPDMSPQEDASHLQLAWTMARGLFRQFPWYDEREESRISDVPPPTALVHATAMAYLNSGVDYARAYKAAFCNEDARNMQQIPKPARVIRWQGSILRKYADRLDEYQWPGHIRMVHAGAGIEERYAALREALRELLSL